jgi:NADH:ubiquinone oxidoreductase subunit 5 (subunit L)/multisubunit Na+/H+ antiporter MnhA subunit
VTGNTLWLWPLLAATRFTTAVRQHWRRIVVGAVVGWLFAVVGGAIALAWLEIENVITHSTADDLGIVLVLYGVGVGALNAYALRPTRQ